MIKLLTLTDVVEKNPTFFEKIIDVVKLNPILTAIVIGFIVVTLTIVITSRPGKKKNKRKGR